MSKPQLDLGMTPPESRHNCPVCELRSYTERDDRVVALDIVAGFIWAGKTTAQELVGRRKGNMIVRRAACHHMRSLGLSLPTIGYALNRDHSTILWHTRQPLNDDHRAIIDAYLSMKETAE